MNGNLKPEDKEEGGGGEGGGWVYSRWVLNSEQKRLTSVQISNLRSRTNDLVR